MAQDTIFRQLYAILHLEFSEDIQDYAPLLYAHIQQQGYRYVESVDEYSEYEGAVFIHHGDIEQAFIDLINSKKAYQDFNYFAAICEQFIEVHPEMKRIEQEGSVMKSASDAAFQSLRESESVVDNLISSIDWVKRAA